MEQRTKMEAERRRGYWQYTLSKVEKAMLQLQSQRADIQQRIAYLNFMQK